MAASFLPRGSRAQRPASHGFSLIETIAVIAVLTLAALGVAIVHPQIFKTQTAGRDAFVGVDAQRACAERLLAARRQLGFASVTNTLCSGMNPAGWNAFSVALTPSSGTPPSCNTANGTTCTATINIAKSSGAAAGLLPVTLQLSAY